MCKGPLVQAVAACATTIQYEFKVSLDVDVATSCSWLAFVILHLSLNYLINLVMFSSYASWL